MHQVRYRALGQVPRLPFGPDAPSPQEITVADPLRYVRERARAAPREIFEPEPEEFELSKECACLVDKGVELATAAGEVVTPAALPIIGAQCEADPAAFSALLKEVGASITSCKPWYKRPAVWIIGGAAVVAGLIVLR